MKMWNLIRLEKFIVVLALLAEFCGGQVVFEEETPPAPSQQRRPQQWNSGNWGGGQGQGFSSSASSSSSGGFGGGNSPGFGNGQGFGSNNGNGQGFGNNNGNGQGFGSNNGNGQGFGNNNGNGQGFGNNGNGQGFGSNNGNGQGFGSNNGNGQGFDNNNGNNGQSSQFQADPAFRTPDCETFNQEGGVCTPLTSCERIGRMLRNRPPFVAARLLRRSICGFNGLFPNVCCPLGRNQAGGDNSLGNGNENSFPPQTFPTTTTATSFRPPQTFPPTRPPPPQTFPTTPRFQPTTTTRNPFGSGGNIGVTLVPPKTTTTGGGGGGLIIIGPTSSPPTSGGGGSSPGLSDIGLPNDCGFSNASHTRIVGGHAASKGAWPWIAALGYKDDAGNVNYLCGGALISKDFVVTASHCVFKRNDLVTVRLGDHDLFTDSDGVTPLDLEIGEIIQHPKYDSATFYNDVALIRLKRSVPFSRQIHPICLPSSPQLRSNRFEDNTPFVAGWGAVQFNGPSSSYLKEVQLPIVPDSVCQEKFKSFKSVNVDGTNICAGFAAGGKDACQGDSGGPLMQPVGNNKYVLIGVVSFGFKCAEAGYPGVYSRITTHLEWIERTIRT